MPNEKLTEKAIALCELNQWPVTYDNVQKVMQFIKEQQQILDNAMSELQ